MNALSLWVREAAFSLVSLLVDNLPYLLSVLVVTESLANTFNNHISA